MTAFALLIFIGGCVISLQWYIGIRRLPVISNYPSDCLRDLPSVTVIVAARDEEKNIYDSVYTLLNQTYCHLEIIVVNDRSTDHTLSLLNKLKASHINHDKLKIITISHLPAGWLGKNHALYQGFLQSKGEILLFTDGDIFFTKETLKRTVNYLISYNLDHLTLIPENKGGTLPYRAFHSYWSIIGIWNFIQLNHAGVGAFNMIRASVYRKIGTHESVALSPDDDLKLGKLVVSKGFRQQLGLGKYLVSVQWYQNIPEVIHGLEKNLFAFMRYRVLYVVLFSIVIFLFHVIPFIGLFTASFFAQLTFAAVISLYALMFTINARIFNDSSWFFLWVPINAFIFIFCLCRSAYKTIRNGGITWRGTRYPLKDSRKK
ncbi:glycosyltransferase [Salipaludibacillus sp. CF4.18]|uniref:glycosyltransferase n=1 Tax=Salipaludibacillus sp. CF4.18 TaxID=3373081 RepID=UPI003EE686D5